MSKRIELDSSEHEELVIGLMNGKTQKQLAADLSISVDTVARILKENPLHNLGPNSLFQRNGKGKLKVRPKTVIATSDVKFTDIVITGDISDGIIIDYSELGDHSSGIQVIYGELTVGAIIEVDELDRVVSEKTADETLQYTNSLVEEFYINEVPKEIAESINIDIIESQIEDVNHTQEQTDSSVYEDSKAEISSSSWGNEYESDYYESSTSYDDGENYDETDEGDYYDEEFYEGKNQDSETESEVTKINEPVVETEFSEDEIEWSATSKYINITRGLESYSVNATHVSYRKILDLLLDNKLKEAIGLISIKEGLKEYTKGNIKIKGTKLFYKDNQIKTGLVSRIIADFESGKEFEKYVLFLDNLMDNTSYRAVNRLYDFLTANDIEITDDGYLMAFKVVTGDYKDCHTKTFDNSIGKVVEIPRNMVDEDNNQTCSYGLHVCSKSYIRHFRGNSDIVVKVKVNPADVVAIPFDYSNAKARVCKYTVIENAVV